MDCKIGRQKLTPKLCRQCLWDDDSLGIDCYDSKPLCL